MDPFKDLFVYSFAMIVLPISTLFFVIRYFSMVWATVLAVSMVHLVLFAFVMKAYRYDNQAAQKID